MGTTINEHRFTLNDRFDKSTYLTNVPRPKAIINFSKPTNRLPDLMAKGGDSRIDLGGKSCDMIDQGLEARTIMQRLDNGVTGLANRTTRNESFGNLYKQEMDYTPDHYDSKKIAEAANKIKKRTKPYVDMKKQTKRDYTSLLNGTDFYKNVQRDNERQDYIKNLLNETV